MHRLKSTMNSGIGCMGTTEAAAGATGTSAGVLDESKQTVAENVHIPRFTLRRAHNFQESIMSKAYFHNLDIEVVTVCVRNLSQTSHSNFVLRKGESHAVELAPQGSEYCWIPLDEPIATCGSPEPLSPDQIVTFDHSAGLSMLRDMIGAERLVCGDGSISIAQTSGNAIEFKYDGSGVAKFALRWSGNQMVEQHIQKGWRTVARRGNACVIAGCSGATFSGPPVDVNIFRKLVGGDTLVFLTPALGGYYVLVEYEVENQTSANEVTIDKNLVLLPPNRPVPVCTEIQMPGGSSRRFKGITQTSRDGDFVTPF